MTQTSMGGSLVPDYAQSFNSQTGQLVINANFTDPGPTRATFDPAPINNTPASFTTSWCAYLPAQVYEVHYINTRDVLPGTIGFTYASQGQTLRPVAPQQVGSQNGPGFGKTKRNHMFSALLQDAQGISFGADFTKMHGAQFKSPGGTQPLARTSLYSGIYWDTLEDLGTTFDGQIAWQVTRPYPCTLTALGGFINTQDR